MGFGSSQVGGSGGHDRTAWINTSGAIWYGVWTGSATTVNSPAGYNDGKWHLVTIIQSSTIGEILYVDGKACSTNSSGTTPQSYTGYWQIGYASSWNYGGYTGAMDEVALLNAILTPTQIQAAYIAGTNALAGQQATQVATNYNLSFESPVVSGYQTSPSGATWTFSGSAGESQNGSAFTSGSIAPDGNQAAFLQSGGSIAQSIPFTGGTYIFNFRGAVRSSYGVEQAIVNFLVDGNTNMTYTTLPSNAGGAAYVNYASTPVYLTNGTHTITFTCLSNPSYNSGDNSALIDDIRITQQNSVVTISPGSLTTNGPVTASINYSGPANSQIYYQLISGNFAPGPWLTYSNPITLTGGTYTLQAYAAVSTNYSPLASATYNINYVNPSTTTLITPVTATAESWYTGDDRNPLHSIDGSGMTPSTPVTINSTCGTAPGGNMWLSNNKNTTWITYDLGSIQTISGFHLWNYNEANYSGHSINTAAIYTGTYLLANNQPYTAGGSSWGTFIQNMIFASAPGSGSYTGSDYYFTAPVTTRYIQFYVINNYDNVNGYTGLSEIRFYGVNGMTSANLSVVPAGSTTLPVTVTASSANGSVNYSYANQYNPEIPGARTTTKCSL